MQKNCENNLQFEFNNSTDTLITSLQYMLGHISEGIPVNTDADDVLFRCKIIITELLTNSIKHGGERSTLFSVEMDNKYLTIRKTDSGSPLYLINTHKHSSINTESNKKLISSDPLNSLYAAWQNENSILFSCEESIAEDFLPVEQVMEHFGILIITRSSDEFTYTYNKQSLSNTFKVKLRF